MAKESGQPDQADVDVLLMGRIAAGDQRAMQLLLDRHWSRLVLYATSIVGSEDEATDVVQHVFITIWERREAWEERGAVRSYLYRITRNAALNHLRSNRTRGDHETDAASFDDEATGTSDRVLDQIHVRTEVERAIAALSERRREVFILSRFHGLSHAEIAEALQTSPQTVANQMSSALAELRLALSHLLRDD